MGTSVKECPAVEGATNHDLVDERPAQVTVTVSASGFSSSMFVNYTHNYSSMSYRSHWEKSFSSRALWLGAGRNWMLEVLVPVSPTTEWL